MLLLFIVYGLIMIFTAKITYELGWYKHNDYGQDVSQTDQQIQALITSTVWPFLLFLGLIALVVSIFKKLFSE